MDVTQQQQAELRKSIEALPGDSWYWFERPFEGRYELRATRTGEPIVLGNWLHPPDTATMETIAKTKAGTPSACRALDEAMALLRALYQRHYVQGTPDEVIGLCSKIEAMLERYYGGGE